MVPLLFSLEGNMNDKMKEDITVMRRAGLSYGVISGRLNVPINTIKSFCRRHLPQTANDREAPNSLTCPECGKKLNQKGPGKPKKFCSEKCRRAWWKKHPDHGEKATATLITCINCGKTFACYGSRNRIYCSHDCYIKHRFRKEVVK